MSTLQSPAETLVSSPHPECGSKLAVNIVSIPMSPRCSESESDEEAEDDDDDDIPLVLLTFALHIDALLKPEEETSPLPSPCPLEDNNSTESYPEITDSKQHRNGSSLRPYSEATAQEIKPIRNITAPFVLPSRDRSLRKPFTECENQRDHKFGVEVGKLKLSTKRSHGEDQKENIPPLRGLFALDV
ncbi:hypothetical protein B0H12DRAFT_512426 [Mycena haematopus]|nr:hypothetical protein B0H12DRAFT_512426 [Mycena haematopus]